MGVRLFLPLPGPFVAVTKSRAEKIVERDHGRAKAERRRAEWEAAPQRDRDLAVLIVLGLVWAYAVYTAFFYDHRLVGGALAVLAFAHLHRLRERQVHRRIAQAEIEADEHDFAAGTGEY